MYKADYLLKLLECSLDYQNSTTLTIKLNTRRIS